MRGRERGIQTTYNEFIPPCCSSTSRDKHFIKSRNFNRLFKMAEAKRNPPFRAEHLGSLLRPKELLQKHAAFEKNELSQQEITEVENESVNKIVKVQLDAGFRAVSDGEYRYITFP